MVTKTKAKSKATSHEYRVIEPSAKFRFQKEQGDAL
jgi:hypothetical protein